MKKINLLITLLSICVVAISMQSCKQIEGEKAKAKEAIEILKNSGSKSYMVVSSESLILWEAGKLGTTHKGTIQVSNGTVNIEKGAVVGGEFTIDMNSIKNTDLKEKKTVFGRSPEKWRLFYRPNLSYLKICNFENHWFG